MARHYSQINAGLTVAQYQAANFGFVTPGGVVYVGKADHSPSAPADPTSFTFLARAPSLGDTFTVLKDWSSFPGGDDRGIAGIGYNPLVADQIGVVMGTEGVDKKFNLSTGGVFTPGAVIGGSGANFLCNVSYGLGAWLVTQNPETWGRLNAAGSSISASGTHTNLGVTHKRASSTGRTFHFLGGNGIIVAENNFATPTDVSDSNLNDTLRIESLAPDPSGTYLMIRYGAGKRGKSTDGGFSYALIPSLFLGNWFFAYAGPGSTLPRFMAAAATVQYSPDFGTTWEDWTNTELNAITPFPAIDMIQVITY